MPQAELILRRVYGVGGAGIVNRHRGARSWAWPSGDWGSLPAKGGIEAAYRAELDPRRRPRSGPRSHPGPPGRPDVPVPHSRALRRAGHHRPTGEPGPAVRVGARRLPAAPRVGGTTQLGNPALVARSSRCASTPTCTSTRNTPGPAAGTATWSTWPGGPRRKGISRRRHRRLHPPGLGRAAARDLVPAEPGLFRLRPDLDRDVAAHAAARCRTPSGSCCRWRSRRSTSATTGPARCTTCSTARLRRGRRVHPRAGQDRQPRLGRPAHPRPRLARPAGDHPRERRRLLPGARARLDAVVRGARLAVRLRRGRGLLRRPRRPHLRGRDRPVLRPGDELARLRASTATGWSPTPTRTRRPCSAARRRCFDTDIGLLRRPPRAGDRRRLRRHRRVLPRGGQVPPRRPPQVRRAHRTRGDQRGRRHVPGLRQAADGRRAHRVEELADREPATGPPTPATSAASSRCRRSWARSSASARRARRCCPGRAPLVTAARPGAAASSATCRSTTSAASQPAARRGDRAAARAARCIREAGYDGEYGVIRLFEPGELAEAAGSVSLFDDDLFARAAQAQAGAAPVASRCARSTPDLSEQPALPEPGATSPARRPRPGPAGRRGRASRAAAGRRRPGAGKTRMLTHRSRTWITARGCRPRTAWPSRSPAAPARSCASGWPAWRPSRRAGHRGHLPRPRPRPAPRAARLADLPADCPRR